jgi:hypothetical protein
MEQPSNMIIQQRMWFRMARGVAESGQETERRHADGRDVLTTMVNAEVSV